MNIASSLLRFWISFAMLMNRESLSLITKYTHQAINGYYCDNAYIGNHTAIGHQRCVAHCITSPSGWVLSYNARGRYCLLGSEPCLASVVNDDFRLMAFRKQEQLPFTVSCISWQFCNMFIDCPSRIVESGFMAIFDHFLPVIHLSLDCYLLVVAETCIVAWLPFVAGDSLPEGAVEGGYLTTIGVTYCMSAFENQHSYTTGREYRRE